MFKKLISRVSLLRFRRRPFSRHAETFQGTCVNEETEFREESTAIVNLNKGDTLRISDIIVYRGEGDPPHWMDEAKNKGIIGSPPRFLDEHLLSLRRFSDYMYTADRLHNHSASRKLDLDSK